MEIRYDKLVEGALRGVIKQALSQVEREGVLPGEHHFYITFETAHDGVDIPAYLKAQYKSEMTIVLQYQFLGLRVEDDKFSVTLTFGGKAERLVVPYAAITTFADPAVNFALQFQVLSQGADEDDDGEDEAPSGKVRGTERARDEKGVPEGEMGQVISLDSFRKKT